MTDDELAQLWVTGASAREISRLSGMSRGAILGRARRRRKAGDLRFPARPQAPSNRLSAQRKRAIKVGMSLDEAHVALPNAGRRLRPAYSLGAAASPLQEPEPEPRMSEPGKRLIDLEPRPVPFQLLSLASVATL